MFVRIKYGLITAGHWAHTMSKSSSGGLADCSDIAAVYSTKTNL